MPLKHFLPDHLLKYISELLNQAHLGIVVSDPNQPDNPIIYANNYITEELGYTQEEIIGKNCRFLQGTERSQEAVSELREAIAKGEAISKVIKNFKKDGSVFYNQLTISPIYDEDHKLKFFLGIQRDVTQLHLSLEQVRATEHLAKIGYWQLDITANELHWSDQVFDLFEIDKTHFSPSYALFLESIHPEDRVLVHETYQKSLKNRELYTIQHRLLMKDGRIKYVEERGISYFDEENKPYKSVGTVQDISYIKEIEIELKNTLSFLSSHKLAIDESSIVTRTDRNGIITYANENFCTISGYEKSEVIGRAHNIVRHPDNTTELFEDLWSTIKAKRVWKKIIKNRDKNGKDYWVDTTILPILDQNEEIAEYIAIRYDVTQMILQQQELRYIANNDILTRLGNRYKLLNDIHESSQAALAIINIDNFAHINDFYGHEIGDKAIQKFANKLLEHRESLGCNLYYMSGDEFVILYKDITQENFLQRITLLEQRLADTEIELSDDFVVFNFSIGVSFETKERLLATADMALKIAKKSNKGLIVYSKDISLEQEYHNNLEWKKVIKDAIEYNRVTPVFQAIVNNKTLQKEKYESLVRIEDGENLISPFFFLEISKKTRHYTHITQIMIEKSFAMFENSEAEFSINLTIEDILSDEITDFLCKMLQENAIGERLVFEIVESESIENFDAVIAFINSVKKYGCKIAIDDFGTGYSNFSYLVRLNPDYIKIDGSLIRDICTNATTEIVVKNLVNFAKDLGMKTIAEFVENEAIYEKVKALGIDYSQGYYFSEPKRALS